MLRLPRLTISLVLMTVAALTMTGQGASTGISRAFSPSATPSFETVCQQVLTRAIDLTEQNCGATGRNEACYGSNLVRVQLQNGPNLQNVRFEQSGDILPVRSIARIQTEGLNPATGDWGMALVKLQANLPNTNPGQNVTFILYGNTSLSPDIGQTNAFYLSTELGEVSCNQLPTSSLMVRSPGHIQVAFTLNGVEIHLASTLVLTANGATLTAQLLEGHASLTALGQTATLLAGQELSVPLDPGTGDAAGTPSEPTTFEYLPATDSLGELVDAMSGEPLEGLITVQGPIELIDAQGGWITVEGRRIHVPPGQLANLEVGQPMRFSGYGHGFIVFELPPEVVVPEGGRLSPATVSALRRSLGLDLSDSDRARRQAGSPPGGGAGQGNPGNRGNQRNPGNPGSQGNQGNQSNQGNQGNQGQGRGR